MGPDMELNAGEEFLSFPAFGDFGGVVEDLDVFLSVGDHEAQGGPVD